MIKISAIINFLTEYGVSFEYIGDQNLNINSYSTPSDIKSDSIIWIKNSENIEDTNSGKYQNILFVLSNLGTHYDLKHNYIVVDNSKEAFFSIIEYFFKKKNVVPFIGDSSIVETDSIGNDVCIGHNCFISSNVSIGDNVVIKNNVVIEGEVTIGDNTVVSSGVIIGSEGYGYFKNSDGKNIKVPHLGGVIIGQDVEIGANTCIDRGTLANTIIGNNVKIDNLCHIAHNVILKDNVSIVALSMIAGSVRIGENAYIAPSSSIMNQITIGENSVVGMGAVVINEVEDNSVVAGVPAKVIRKIGDN
ncbi:UDP-3-O-(3-hydroxymyristoyl)glucosamine N-acyltransferase [Proteocatella sphenisci]|uniref:UDP-3-O-(3-hydroxymyristoyl)glucosamine N-acyltransferase n=1 Tax=Proteocatella sphenisci TaxID=181070 RepID=UPI0004B7DAA1|nr:UDP-3-O-(3-hydroxymyristoyl)glucosamine N-acyltransferase [Proteocatella sphenisci]